MQPEVDPYLGPSYSLSHRGLRALWHIVYVLLFRSTPRPLHAWRAFLLRRFGATLGPHCRIYPKAKIWAPWNLICEDAVAVGDDAEIYNHALVTLRSHAIVSQGAYLCSATHDFNDPAFALVATPIEIGNRAWICARATVMPGIRVGDGAVLALGSVATRELEPWKVYAGIPARQIADRTLRQ